MSRGEALEDAHGVSARGQCQRLQSGKGGQEHKCLVDCLIDLDADRGLITVHCDSGSVVALELLNVKSFRRRCPDQYHALIECSFRQLAAARRE